jgi:hypothetical protein
VIEGTANPQLDGLRNVSSPWRLLDSSAAFYCHTDSGATAMFFALNSIGTLLGTFTLSGVTAIDWEDIAIGPGPTSGSYLYIGDIGDNAARTGTGTARTDIIVYRMPEPSVSTSSTSSSISNWQRLRFTYPDKAHDAETLMVDPVTGDIVIVTKETNGASKVFRAAGTVAADSSTVLELQATLSIGTSGSNSELVTAGDISPSGDAVIVRSYTAIWLWCRQSTWTSTFSVTPTELPSATETQGEALTFSSDGLSWYSSGEETSSSVPGSLYHGVATCS